MSEGFRDDSAAEAIAGAVNKQITSFELDAEEQIELKFSDGTGLRIWDGGQRCCENRYTTTDDVLADFVGEHFISAEVREGGDLSTEEQIDRFGDVHETQFLLITTTRGVATFETHVEHNGYYGGFCISACEVTS